MSYTYFARSMAAATVIGMLAVSAPALAQTTTPDTATQGTTTQGTTTPQSTTPTPDANPNCPSATGSATSPQPPAATGSTTTAASSTANCPPADTTKSATGGTVKDMGTTPTSTTPTSTTPTNSTNNTGTSAGQTMQPTAGSTMTNALRDNPNGSNWLQKFNRPNVAASNRRGSKYRTNKLGTTQPPQP